MDCRTARDRAITFGELIFTQCVPEIMYQFIWSDKEQGKGTWRFHNGKYWIYVDESQVMNPTYDTQNLATHPAGTEPKDILAGLDETRVRRYTRYVHTEKDLSPQGV